MLTAVVSSTPVLPKLVEALRVQGREKTALWLDGRQIVQSPPGQATAPRIGIASAIKPTIPASLATAGGVGVGVSGLEPASPEPHQSPATRLAERIHRLMRKGRSCRAAFNAALADITGDCTVMALFTRLPKLIFVACKGAFVRIAIGRDDTVAFTDGAQKSFVADGRDTLLFMDPGDTAICSAGGATVYTSSGRIKDTTGPTHFIMAKIAMFADSIRKG